MDKSRSESKVVPLKPGLFHLPASPDEKGYLIGSKCRNCGHYFWPRRYVCLNCGKGDQEEVPLSTRGKIWSYCISRMTPAESFIVAPYIVAQVHLLEKVIVKTIVEGDPDTVKVGMDVEFATRKVTQDPDGNDVVAFVFKTV